MPSRSRSSAPSWSSSKRCTAPNAWPPRCALDKGQLLGEQGDANGALLWIARSLKLAPVDAGALPAVARNNLGAWRSQIYPLRAILPHQTHIFALAFSSDGKTLLTAGHDSIAHVWDATTGEQIRKPIAEGVRHPGGTMFAVAFSPDGKTMVAGGKDQTARLWEMGTGKVLWSLPLNEEMTTAAFSAQGGTVLVAWGSSFDERHGRAQLLEVATGKPLSPPLEHDRLVCAAAFSPDGKLCVTGKRLGPPLLHSGSVQQVAFWHDGKTVLTAGEDKIARFWQLPTPVDGDTEQIELWSQVLTGMELEADGGGRVLDVTTWQQRRAKLEDSGFHSL